MNRHIPIYMLVALLVSLNLLSCNKDDNNGSSSISDYSVYSSATTLVQSFSLMANSKVLSGLDSVHFAIDQERGLIYNADSLPYGTNVSALCVNITCASTVVGKDFIVKGGEVQKDTIFAYTSTTKDSVDFTGDVTLRITAYDGDHTRDYKVMVNVHKQKPDTIMWNASRRRDLPGITTTLRASKTVQQDDEFLCLVNDNGTYTLSTATDPMAGTWTKKTLSLPFEPQVNSLAATDDAIYILDTNGALYSSPDSGDTWNPCGVVWTTLIGAYDGKVLGIREIDGAYYHDEFPVNYVPTKIENGFPVKGMSQLVEASNQWTASQQAMIAGGLLANGTYSTAVWGYDGTKWGQIDVNGASILPPLFEPTLIPYYTYTVSTSDYSATRNITWLLMGGLLAGGKVNITTYASSDQGIHWTMAPDGLQQPDHLPAFYGAQAYVLERTAKAAASAPKRAYNPGVTKPVTEWEVPYIYLFGGTATNGLPLTSLWEGVLLRTTYKPVY